jgi:hypothetical protein
MPATEHEDVIEHSFRTVRTQRSATAFAFGARTGVLITRTPSDRTTWSNGPENLASRSWISGRGRCPPSSRSISRLGDCCSIQSPSGLLVQARYSIRRLPVRMKTSTYNRRRKTVSTVRKSRASVVVACWRRNERHFSRRRERVRQRHPEVDPVDEGLFQVRDDGDGSYDGQIGHAYLHLDDGSTGDEGRDLGFITLAATAEIARKHDAELDADGPTREEWEITEPPRRSFFNRLLGG